MISFCEAWPLLSANLSQKVPDRTMSTYGPTTQNDADVPNENQCVCCGERKPQGLHVHLSRSDGATIANGQVCEHCVSIALARTRDGNDIVEPGGRL